MCNWGARAVRAGRGSPSMPRQWLRPSTPILRIPSCVAFRGRRAPTPPPPGRAAAPCTPRQGLCPSTPILGVPRGRHRRACLGVGRGGWAAGGGLHVHGAQRWAAGVGAKPAPSSPRLRGGLRARAAARCAASIPCRACSASFPEGGLARHGPMGQPAGKLGVEQRRDGDGHHRCVGDHRRAPLPTTTIGGLCHATPAPQPAARSAARRMSRSPPQAGRPSGTARWKSRRRG